MADFTKTISNGLIFFGCSESTKWGDANGLGLTMVWGTSKWGEGTNNVIYNLDKLISSDLFASNTVFFNPSKILLNDFFVSSAINQLDVIKVYTSPAEVSGAVYIENEKLISNDLYPSGMVNTFDVKKIIDNTLSPDTVIIIDENQKLISNDLTIDEDSAQLNLSQGAWNFVYPSETDNAHLRISSTAFTSITGASLTYTSLVATTTTWS